MILIIPVAHLIHKLPIRLFPGVAQATACNATCKNGYSRP